MALFDGDPIPDALAGQTPLASPLSILWAGNPRDQRRGPAGYFPDPQGGLTAGLRATMFTLPAQPQASPTERERPRQVSTGPTPQQVLTRGRRF